MPAQACCKFIELCIIVRMTNLREPSALDVLVRGLAKFSLSFFGIKVDENVQALPS